MQNTLLLYGAAQWPVLGPLLEGPAHSVSNYDMAVGPAAESVPVGVDLGAT
jgi:hypothetical protein